MLSLQLSELQKRECVWDLVWLQCGMKWDLTRTLQPSPDFCLRPAPRGYISRYSHTTQLNLWPNCRRWSCTVGKVSTRFNKKNACNKKDIISGPAAWISLSFYGVWSPFVILSCTINQSDLNMFMKLSLTNTETTLFSPVAPAAPGLLMAAIVASALVVQTLQLFHLLFHFPGVLTNPEVLLELNLETPKSKQIKKKRCSKLVGFTSGVACKWWWVGLHPAEAYRLCDCTLSKAKGPLCIPVFSSYSCTK